MKRFVTLTLFVFFALVYLALSVAATLVVCHYGFS
jgi:hypothetical protein